MILLQRNRNQLRLKNYKTGYKTGQILFAQTVIDTGL